MATETAKSERQLTDAARRILAIVANDPGAMLAMVSPFPADRKLADDDLVPLIVNVLREL